ncbi:vWA domain-containing protein [Megalodesulfovibrio gigas]|uniref:Putative von Willebrand factor, type A n=1 Tax=Megalodesulfovibrio gigas (strain ATCC 19364 / DSM 1382 / NCIMB 9332 / VKM B-1759) TaxID=1121448 RepID=T2GF14_MEGG1|nr:VWA domain-containing protein [Megalodesulfovibrio gigas]AGW14883.1 putative von Willebrand factor, type A [Megalodesulfovibrio gigas DSM 1382 = ATCC 19364]
MQRAPMQWLFLFCVLVAAACTVLGFSRQTSLPAMPAAASAATLSAGEGPLAMTATLTQSKLVRGSDGRTTLSLTLKAAAGEGPASPSGHPAVNQPMDVAVVLDRSGSMRGDKMAGAKEALRTLVAAMTERDRFALVSYADDVVVHQPLARCTPQTKAALLEHIESLEAGGNTNLGAGLEYGLQALQQASESANARLVLLVSDGLANRGVTDAVQLGRMAAKGLAQDVMLSTVGVGLDFNEFLMTRIADQGGGSYRFLEDPRTFAAGFFEEFATVRRAVALHLELRIHLPRGVQLLEASGYPVDMDGDVAVIRPGSLADGASRTLHLTLQARTDQPAAFEIGPVSVRYGPREAQRALHLTQPLVVACVEGRADADASIDKGSWERKVLTEDYNKLKEDVAAKVRGGDAAGARASIDHYVQTQQAANQAVGSERVQDNLEKDVEQLRQQVDETLAAPPAARPALQNRMAKSMQYESYSGRRDK